MPPPKGKGPQISTAGPSSGPQPRAPSTDEVLGLVFWVRDVSRKPMVVEVRKSETVSDLLSKIKKMRKLDHVPDEHIDLWQVEIPYTQNAGMKAKVDAYELTNELLEGRSISELFQDQPSLDQLHIVACIVQSTAHRILERGPFTSDVDPIVSFRLPDSQCFTHLNGSHLRGNDVIRVYPDGAPQALRDLRDHLRRKRLVHGHMEAVALLQHRLTDWFDNFFAVQSQAVQADSNPLDRVTLNELGHYNSLFSSSQLLEKENYDENQECQVRCLLLDFLGMIRLIPANWGFATQWPFQLLAETRDGNSYQYTPMNDFHMRIRNFPHLILEIASQSAERDNNRLLLQASCLARIGNRLRGQHTGPVVVMAIYINEGFYAHRYLVHQPNVLSTEVQYIAEEFDLRTPRGAFELIFQMYNFASQAKQENDNFHEPEERLQKAREEISARRLPLLVPESKEHECTSGCQHPACSHNVPGHQQVSLDNSSVQEHLAAAGYQLTEIAVEGLTLLTPLKPTLRQATSRNGVSVVLKLLDHGNRELDFLRYLSNIKDSANHTLPLLDVINLNVGKKVIALPWRSRLDETLRFHEHPDSIVPICAAQFIQGVAFLHEQKVAHRDLKPGNVVVDPTRKPPQLFIIDFDLAEFVESEETMVEGWCGTLPWIAPEVGTRDGPVQRYSAILTDRWTCGRMMGYFARYTRSHDTKRDLEALAKQLSNNNPRARPSLSTVKLGGGRKRKLETNEGPGKKRRR